jgi:hypothetical protein
MQNARAKGWLRRVLERASEEVESRPLWRKPEEMRLADIERSESEKVSESQDKKNRYKT